MAERGHTHLEAAGSRLGNVMMVDSLVVTGKHRPATRAQDLAGYVIGRARGVA